jgi:hypothetical protein
LRKRNFSQVLWASEHDKDTKCISASFPREAKLPNISELLGREVEIYSGDGEILNISQLLRGRKAEILSMNSLLNLMYLSLEEKLRYIQVSPGIECISHLCLDVL